MEKVEKLLLLVVLGAAMIIMSVMSFGSEDPAVTPGGTTAKNSSENPIANPAGAEVPSVGTDVTENQGVVPGRRSVSRLLLDVEHPGAENAAGRKENLAKGKAPNPAEAARGGPLDPLAPNKGAGPEMGMQKSTPGLNTADLALKPGDDPRIWIYEVQPNESMGVIAAKVTGSQKNMYEIASFNEGMDLNRIRTGQKIQIPSYLIQDRKMVQKGGGATPGLAKAAAVSPSSPLAGRRIVPGMIRAPEKEGLSTNGVSRVGRGRGVPREATSPARPKTEDYRIRKGETLWAIAKSRVGERGAMAYVRKIQDLNPDLDPTSLREKEIILLPAR